MSKAITTTTVSTVTVSKPTRMTKQDKLHLRTTAHRLVDQWAERATTDASKRSEKTAAKIAAQIAAILKLVFPQKDMRVLAEYGAACPLRELQLPDSLHLHSDATSYVNIASRPWCEHAVLGDVLVMRGDFVEGDDGHYLPAIPKNFNINIHDSDTLSGSGIDAVLDTDEYRSVSNYRGEIAAEAQRRKNAYDALITQSTTFEQVADVWPEIKVVIERMKGAVPPVLVPDNIRSIIEADVRERAQAQASLLPAPDKSASSTKRAA